MTHRPKILIVSPVSSDRSISMDLYKSGLVNILKRAGLSFDVMSTENSVRAHVFSKISEVCIRYIYYPLRVMMHPAKIVHITDHTYSYLCPFIKFVGKKCIVSLHNDTRDVLSRETWKKHKEYALIPWLSRFLFRISLEQLVFADTIICISRGIYSTLRSQGVREDKLIIIPPPISDIFFTPLTKTDRRTLYNLKRKKGDTTYILHVGGNDTAHKNVEHILRCVQMFKREGARVVFVKVGDTFSETQNEYIHAHQIQDSILHFGTLSQKKLKLIYHLCDVLLFPSLYEGLPAAPLEAMACGLPVVVSRISAHTEHFDTCAYFCNPNSPRSSIQVIYQMRIHPESVIKRDKIGRKTARRLRWKYVTYPLLALYRQPTISFSSET